MTILDIDDASNRKPWHVQEPATLSDDQAEDWWTRHTAAEAATEVGAEEARSAQLDDIGAGIFGWAVAAIAMVAVSGLIGWAIPELLRYVN